MSNTPTCDGCHDDFYNGNNPHGVKQCWHRKGARPVTRYRIHFQVVPTRPRAFEEVRVLSCRTEQGYALCKTLPDFVKPEDVVRRKAQR